MLVQFPPESFTEEQRDYLLKMFNSVNDDKGILKPPKRGTLPQSVGNGTIFYFTQIIGATITSIGFWGYENGTWVKL